MLIDRVRAFVNKDKLFPLLLSTTSTESLFCQVSHIAMLLYSPIPLPTCRLLFQTILGVIVGFASGAVIKTFNPSKQAGAATVNANQDSCPHANVAGHQPHRAVRRPVPQPVEDDGAAAYHLQHDHRCHVHQKYRCVPYCSSTSPARCLCDCAVYAIVLCMRLCCVCNFKTAPGQNLGRLSFWTFTFFIGTMSLAIVLGMIM